MAYARSHVATGMSDLPKMMVGTIRQRRTRPPSTVDLGRVTLPLRPNKKDKCLKQT